MEEATFLLNLLGFSLITKEYYVNSILIISLKSDTLPLIKVFLKILKNNNFIGGSCIYCVDFQEIQS